MASLNKKLIDALHPTGDRMFAWDDKIAGFGLVIQPSGSKSYCFQYRNAEGQSRRITIGKHGPLTPDQARDLARDLAHAVHRGEDPAGDKRARRSALTVGEVFDAYLRSPKYLSKAPETRSIDKGRIDRHLRPLLGTRTADKLKPDEIRRAHTAIVSGKTAATIKTGLRGKARVRGGEGTARMAIRLLKAIYAWAVEQELVPSNPATPVRVGADGKRDAVVSGPEEYKRMFGAIQHAEDHLEIPRAAADAIRIIALTGARRGEISGLRWRHIRLAEGVAVLGRDEHKTGKKTSTDRVIGLPTAAQAIIARQPPGEPDQYVFPGRGGKRITLNSAWRKIRTAAGLRADLGLHGLRHSLASSMAINGAQAGAIMAVMGHRSLSTAQRYIHIAQDARATIAEQAAAGISAALAGSNAAPVVAMPKKPKRAK